MGSRGEGLPNVWTVRITAKYACFLIVVTVGPVWSVDRETGVKVIGDLRSE